MKLIPFLIAAFLLINPLLDWIFRKLKIQTEKLQFWVMLTSGTAWVLALAAIFLKLQSELTPVEPAVPEILPRLAFALDGISGAMVLSAVGLVFAVTLTRQGDPRANAWLAGLGGACVIGLESNSAYTLGLAWTIVEGIHFYFFYRDRRIVPNPREYLPVVLLRISAPGTLILLSLTVSEPGSLLFTAAQDSRSAPILIAAGLLGFLGWFLSVPGPEEARGGNHPGAVENWIAGLLGIYLIVRGGALSEAGAGPGVVPLILSAMLLIAALAGTLLDRTPALWFLGCGLLATTTALISGEESALSWAVVMALPGTRLWQGRIRPRAALIPLLIASAGLLPIPFLPAWAGASAFSAGIPGILLGLSFGVLLGSALNNVLKAGDPTEPDSGALPLLGIIGAAAVLVSQAVIAFKYDLIAASGDLLGKPVTSWISLLGMIPVLILGNHLPLRQRTGLSAGLSRLAGIFWDALKKMVHLADQLVDLISRIFEGQAGLIWALLIGLLLITLVSIGGG